MEYLVAMLEDCLGDSGLFKEDVFVARDGNVVKCGDLFWRQADVSRYIRVRASPVLASPSAPCPASSGTHHCSLLIGPYYCPQISHNS